MTNDGKSVLYYEFQFSAGGRDGYGGIWHWATVWRVTPGERDNIGRTVHATRWGAKRGAKRRAKEDLKWLAACAKDERTLWRP